MPTILDVRNIHCGACAQRVTNAIRQADPRAVPTVDPSSGTVTMEPPADLAAVLAALDKAGYPATVRT